MSITKQQLENNTHEMLARIFALAEKQIKEAVEAEVIDRDQFQDNFRPAAIVAKVVLEHALKQYAPAQIDCVPEGPLRKAGNRFYHLKEKKRNAPKTSD